MKGLGKAFKGRKKSNNWADPQNLCTQGLIIIIEIAPLPPPHVDSGKMRPSVSILSLNLLQTHQFSSPASVFLETSAFQNSWVSLTVLMAKSCKNGVQFIRSEVFFSPQFPLAGKRWSEGDANFLNVTLSLKSPLKANWFSGFPSGTLYRLNQSTVASRYPGLFRRTSSISASHQQKKERTLKVPLACASADLAVVSLPYCYSRQHLGRLYWSQWPSSLFLLHQSAPVFQAPSLWLPPLESTPKNGRYCVKSCREMGLYVFSSPRQWLSTLFPMSHMSIGSLSPQHPVSLSLWLGSSHVWGGEAPLKDGGETGAYCGGRTYLWNGSIVPDVAFVRKHICHVSKISLLYVLLQRIKRLFGSYLTEETTPKQLADGGKQKISFF